MVGKPSRDSSCTDICLDVLDEQYLKSRYSPVYVNDYHKKCWYIKHEMTVVPFLHSTAYRLTSSTDSKLNILSQWCQLQLKCLFHTSLSSLYERGFVFLKCKCSRQKRIWWVWRPGMEDPGILNNGSIIEWWKMAFFFKSCQWMHWICLYTYLYSTFSQK